MNIARAWLLAAAATVALASDAHGEWTVWGSADGLIDDRLTSVYADPTGSIWVGTVIGLSQYDGVSWRNFGPAAFGASEPIGDILFILRDRAGFVWVGPYRFDGTSWRRFTTADGLAADQVGEVFEDRSGVLWFATAAGVSRFDGTNWRTFTRADGLAANQVIDIFEDASGAMWFATDDGVSSFDGTTWRTYRKSDGLPGYTVTAVGQDADGAMWFGSNGGGATRFDGSTWRTFTAADSLASGYVTGFLRDHLGVLWEWSGFGASTWDGTAWHRVALPVGGFNLESIAEDRWGALWFGWYNYGIARFDRALSRTYTPADGLATNLPAQAIDDRSGNLWFASGWTNTGVSRFDGRAWRTFTTADGLASDDVFTTYQDRAGNWWFGGTGVTRYDGSSFQTYPPFVDGPEGRANLIAEDRSGALWVTGDNVPYLKVWRFDGATWSDAPIPDAAVAMAADSTAGIWIGTYAGAVRFDGATWTTYTTQDGLPSNAVVNLAVDAGGAVWAATDAGLARFEGGSWRTLTAGEGAPTGAIRLVAVGPSGAVWVVAGDAVSRFDGVSWTTFTRSDGLVVDEVVKGIAFARDGGVWIASDIGVSRFAGGEWGTYGVPDGLADPEVQSLLAARSGEMWFVTSSGVTRLAPDRVPPHVSVVSRPAAVSASSSQSISFTAAFRESRGIRFSYAFDDGPWSPWSLESNWTATAVTNGPHSLRIRARDAIGNVEPQPVVVTFEVDLTPPAPVLSAPAFGQAVRDSLAIFGTASDARFRRFEVQLRPLGIGAPPASTLRTSTSPVADGFLAGVNTRTFADGLYDVVVLVTDTLGLVGSTQARVEVDNTAPSADRTSPAVVSATAGGDVFSVTGDAHAQFPPRAFANDATVALDPVDPAGLPALPVGPRSASGTFAISWAAAPLAKPAILDLRPNASVARGAASVYFLPTGGATWEGIGGTSDAATGRIACRMEREGAYTLVTGGSAAAGGAAIAALRVVPRVFSPRGAIASGDVAIAFTLGRAGPVTVRVYNRAGRLVREVTRGVALGPGSNVVRWDGRDEQGGLAPEGVYLVSVDVAGQQATSTLGIAR
jgi:ligand-binding sensor domain-containing protein